MLVGIELDNGSFFGEDIWGNFYIDEIDSLNFVKENWFNGASEPGNGGGGLSNYRFVLMKNGIELETFYASEHSGYVYMEKEHGNNHLIINLTAFSEIRNRLKLLEEKVEIFYDRNKALERFHHLAEQPDVLLITKFKWQLHEGHCRLEIEKEQEQCYTEIHKEKQKEYIPPLNEECESEIYLSGSSVISNGSLCRYSLEINCEKSLVGSIEDCVKNWEYYAEQKLIYYVRE